MSWRSAFYGVGLMEEGGRLALEWFVATRKVVRTLTGVQRGSDEGLNLGGVQIIQIQETYLRKNPSDF